MLDSGDEVDCITDRKGLQAVFLNLWVIQTAYFSYRPHLGELPDKIDHGCDETN